MKTSMLVLLAAVALSFPTGCLSSSRPNTEQIEEKNDSVRIEKEDISSRPAAIPVATREIADQLDKLQGEMISLKDYVSGKKTNPRFFLNLPEKLYALVGEELNVFFDNLVDGHDSDYDFKVDCSIGMQLERCFRVVPTEPGTFSLSIKATDRNGFSFVRKSTIYVADSSAGTGKDRTIIIIGDSTTNNGICVDRLNFNFSEDPMTLHTLGTRGSGENMHEGRSGWTFSLYCSVEQDRNDVLNPFFNPDSKTFDAQYYFSKTNIAKPDWIFINLGINDTFSYGDDQSLEKRIDGLNTMCDDMIKSILSASPKTKIGIVLTIPPNYSQDAFGKAYYNRQTRNRYKRNNVIWVNNLLNRYENRESEQIYIVPVHTNLDTKYNMGLEDIPYNKRNPETYASPIANGGVHPVTAGYWQIADVYWYFLKAFEQFSETDNK